MNTSLRTLLASPVRRRALIIASQLVLTTLAWYAAFAVRYDFAIPSGALARFAATLPLIVVLRFALAHRFRLDRSYWQHVGLHDVVRIVAAATIGSLAFPLVLLLLKELHGIPATVFLLDWVFVIGLTGGVRIAARSFRERLYLVPTSTNRLPQGQRTRAFIIGAGEAGEQVLRQILHDQRHRLDVVGLIDDDPRKKDMQLHGVQVLGSSADFKRLVAIHRAELALIAIPTATPEQIRRLATTAVEAGVKVKMLPPLQDMVADDVQMSQVRDVEIDDLLGREPVNLDLSAVAPDLAGKVILVTGAGGSIGSELVRQIARFGPARLVLLERAESPLYFIQIGVSREYPDIDVVPMLASVTNEARLEQIFETWRPDIVFHAAAYKHVPMLEANVVEGVWNNVIGTLRLARCAARWGTRKFVNISTDKAVNPTSILGATKLVGERIVLELPSLKASATDFRVVRFGNVLGSDGSVVPLFRKQLDQGGPLTVTHPDVKRYFMTIPEATQLVLQATASAECAGRIALLEMGAQIKIVDLAEKLIKLAGLEPHRDIEIVYTGLRPGEKLEEELLAAGERALPTSMEKIRIAERPGARSALLAQQLRQLIRVTASRDEQALIRALKSLVPDYQPAFREQILQGGARSQARRANGGRSSARPMAIAAGSTAKVRRNGTLS
jgi:FlaA1/EpsC-like NDP-sugar epimerase